MAPASAGVGGRWQAHYPVIGDGGRALGRRSVVTGVLMHCRDVGDCRPLGTDCGWRLCRPGVVARGLLGGHTSERCSAGAGVVHPARYRPPECQSALALGAAPAA